MSDQETFNQSGTAVKNQKGKKSKPVNWIEAPQQSIQGLQKTEGANRVASEEKQGFQLKESKNPTDFQDTQNNVKTFKSMSSTVTTAFLENVNSQNKDGSADKLNSSHKTSNSGQVIASKYEQGNRVKANTTFKDYHQQFQMNDTQNTQNEAYNQRGDGFQSTQGTSQQIGMQNNNSGYQYLSYVTNHKVPIRGGPNQYMNNFQQSGQISSETEGEERTSKVLLVIVQNPRDEVIQHKIIFNKFISFGNVEQILIFSKKQQWKFFVDMDSLENAVKARRYLDNSTINIYGKDLKMRVQYSNQQELQLKNGNPGGINYKELNSKFENTQLSYSSPIDNYPPSQLSEEFYQAQRRLLDGNTASNDNARFKEMAFNQSNDPSSDYSNFLAKNAQQSQTSLSAQITQTTAKNHFLSVNLHQSSSLPKEIALQAAENNQMDILTKQPKEKQQEEVSYEGQDSQYSFGKGMENSSQGLPQNDPNFPGKIEMNNSLNFPHQEYPGQSPFQKISNLAQPFHQQTIGVENPVSLKNESLTEQFDDLLKQINNNGNEEDDEEDEVKQSHEFTEQGQQSEKEIRDFQGEDGALTNQQATQINEREQIISPNAAGENVPTKGLKKLDQLLSNCESQENSLVVSDNDDEDAERVWSDNGIGFDSSSKNALFQDYQQFAHSENLNSRAYLPRTQPQTEFYQNPVIQEPFSQQAQQSSSNGFPPYPTQIKSANILQTMSQYPPTNFNLNQQGGNLPQVYNNHGPQIHYPNQQLLSGQYGGSHHQHRFFSGNISSQSPAGITYSPSQKQQGFIQPQYLSQSPLGQDYNIQQSGQMQLQQPQQTFAGISSQQFSGQPFGTQNKPSQSLSGQITGNQVVQENMGMFHGSTYVKQGFLEDSRPSKVIYINHLASPLIQLTHLYNVFSNFGDIVKILFKRPKGTAFIEYTTQEFATRSKDCMDKKVFFESEVRVFYSHFESLLSQQEDKQSEIFLGSEQTHRFIKDPKMTLNAPSLVIHISNLKQEVCDHEKMHELFHPFGKIEAIHIEKNPPRYMCHIKFSQIKESLMAVAYMHNYETKGRKMFLSFTRKKLDSSMPIKNMVLYSKQTSQI